MPRPVLPPPPERIMPPPPPPPPPQPVTVQPKKEPVKKVQPFVPPPPAPPPPAPQQEMPKARPASPPARPPPPPRFRDECLSYEALKQQEIERIQRQCKKITLIEQRERQVNQRVEDRSVFIEETLKKPEQPSVPLPPIKLVSSPTPYSKAAVPPQPTEVRVITELIQKPEPRNLEEAVSEFYKVHEETCKRVYTQVIFRLCFFFVSH